MFVVGTFDMFVRNGTKNNNDVISCNGTLQSIVYLLPWVQDVGDKWMYEYVLEHLDFTGLISLEFVDVFFYW